MITYPYFAEFDSHGTACVFEIVEHGFDRPDTRERLLWELVGHTTLEVAQYAATQLNLNLVDRH